MLQCAVPAAAAVPLQQHIPTTRSGPGLPPGLLADRSEFTQDNGQAVCMGRRIAAFLLSAGPDLNLLAMLSLKMAPNQV
jgi:hypothetical protein